MKYDHIIIGAGSAGAILATRLTEDPSKSVLLLEAGADFANVEDLPDEIRHAYPTGDDVDTSIISSVHNWQFTGRPTPEAEPMRVPRGKVTGGSSAINGTTLLRGAPEDYDTWESLGNEGWRYEDCLPFFRKLETDTNYSDDFHGTEGPIICRRFQPDTWREAPNAFYQSCRDYGFEDCPDHNNPDSTGVGPMPFNNVNGLRLSTNLAYLGLSRHRLNLTIRPNCMVQRIEFDGSRATGVVVESGGETFTVEGEEIVLSAGAIGSPQILLLSGVGPSGHLKDMGIPVVRDLPGVGQNLRDHPIVPVTWKSKPEHKIDNAGPLAEVGLRFTATGSDLRNDMIVYMFHFATDRGIGSEEGTTPIGVQMIIALNLAIGSGELKLQSTDPNVQPLLDYNYFTEEFDRERMREALRICSKLGEHEAWNSIIESRIEPPDEALESDDALDGWMRRKATTAHHISGTAKMGPASDPMAVVDKDGKVHGLEGLRVADASIMPDCVRANINATVMMIGEKIADAVKLGR